MIDRTRMPAGTLVAAVVALGLAGAGSAEAGEALASQESDTLIAVERGARLELRNHAGSVAVGTWERDEVRVRAEFSGRRRIPIRREGSVVRIRAHPGQGEDDEEVRFRITVPGWMAVDVGGVETSIRLQGMGGEVSARSVEGDIDVGGGSGRVSVVSVDGDVSVRDASGTIRVENVDGDVRIDGARGEVTAESVDGDVILRDVESDAVTANTVDGEIEYRGTLRDGGSYRFSTHDGDIFVEVREGTNATITISSVDGELDSSFPVTLEQRVGGGRYTYSFSLGDGSARVEMSTFDGVIRLRRPGEGMDE